LQIALAAERQFSTVGYGAEDTTGTLAPRSRLFWR
jgi:hypothetical protein